MKQVKSNILLVCGIASFVGSTAFTIKGTTCAIKACEKEKEKLKVDKLTFGQALKVCWKYYIPTVISVASGITCTILSNKVILKQNAAVLGAYTLSQAGLQAFQDESKKLLGEAKAKELSEKVSEKIVSDNIDKKNKEIYIDEDKEKIYYEPMTGRYFKSRWIDIENAAIKCNKSHNIDETITMNEWFQYLGLESTELGEEFGWRGYNGEYIDIYVDMIMPKGKDYPVGAIGYNILPKSLK